MIFRFGRPPGQTEFSAPVRAAFWITLAGVLFTATITSVRQVTPDLHVFEAVMFRSLFGIVFMVPWLIRRGISQMRTRKIGLLAIRGSLAFFVTTLYFWAATMMPLADLVSITFTRPIMGTIAAVLFLHEVARARRWSAIAVGFIGMLIIVRPGFATLNVGMIMVLGGVCFQTCNTIIVKTLTKTEQSDTIALYHTLFILPLSIIPAIIFWKTPTLTQLGWLVAVGGAGIMTQRAMTRAFAAADASYVLALSYLRLPIAALIGFAVFGEVPVIWVWIGGAVIAGSSTYIARREAVNAREEAASQKIGQ